MPCLHDRYEEGGATKSEYFWQELLVARAIYAAKPVTHVNIGSRVDSFVAHVVSFREIEVMDVRPSTTAIPGIGFRQLDLMDSTTLPSGPLRGGGYCDSLSCLHALEHFGLGRYGDPVNPQGYQQGIANMASLVRPGGRFYLSTPIGQERVKFNVNWVLDPRSINCATNSGLKLTEITVITPAHGAQETPFDDKALDDVTTQRYQLGLFTLIKIEDEKSQHANQEC